MSSSFVCRFLWVSAQHTETPHTPFFLSVVKYAVRCLAVRCAGARLKTTREYITSLEMSVCKPCDRLSLPGTANAAILHIDVHLFDLPLFPNSKLLCNMNSKNENQSFRTI